MNSNLEKIGKTNTWLLKELEKFNLKPEQVLVATYDRRWKNVLSSKGKQKMKEIIIIILILIIIIFGGITTQNYLNSTSQELIKDLDNIKALVKNDNYTELNYKCNELYNNWKSIEKKWSIIVLHNELDLIEQALIETKVNIEKQNTEDGMVAIEKSIFLIKHIPEKESLRLKNVF